MLSYVNYLKTLAEHLDAVGDPVLAKDLVIILISSLPEAYSHLINAFETIAEGLLGTMLIDKNQNQRPRSNLKEDHAFTVIEIQ